MKKETKSDIWLALALGCAAAAIYKLYVLTITADVIDLALSGLMFILNGMSLYFYKKNL